MRKDMKLGLLFSFVIVVVAGWYYTSTDKAEEPLTLADSSSARQDRTEPSAQRAPTLLADAGKLTPAKTGKQTDRSRKPAANRTAGKQPGAQRAAKTPTRKTRTPAGAKARHPNAVPRADAGKPKSKRPTNSGKPGPDGDVAPANTEKSSTPVRKTPTPKAADRDKPTEEAKDTFEELWQFDESASASTKRPASTPARGVKRDAVSDEQRGATARREGKQTPAAKPKPRAKAERSPREKATSKTTKGHRTHTIRRGDSYALLAEQYYGSQRHAKFLMDANPEHSDPRRLREGVVLRVPPMPNQPGTAHSAGSLRRPSGTAGERTYVVRGGDSFYRIAVRELGSGSRWPELFELNKNVVDGKPERLRPGQVLRLPSSKPATAKKKT